MIANETELKRGVLLSFLSSMLQGVVAILLVGAAYLVLRGSSISMTQATTFLERVSFAWAAFGAYLLVRKLRRSLRLAGAKRGAGAGRRPGLPLHHDHAHSHHGHSHHAHDHHHGHAHAAGEVCATCGHAHAPIRRSCGPSGSTGGRPGRPCLPLACGPVPAR